MGSTVHNNQNSVFSASTASVASLAVANGAGLFINSGSNSNPWGKNTSHATFPGPVEFHDDITWKGRNLGQLMASIEDRLAILAEPTPKKLKKFAALKKAYDQYKVLEVMCVEDEDES